MTDKKPYREFWIKKGSGDWDYINYADDNSSISLDYGDNYYDKVSLRPTDDGSGIHVIEYSAFSELDLKYSKLSNYCSELESTISEKEFDLQEAQQKIKWLNYNYAHAIA